MPLVWGVHEWKSKFSLKPKLPLPFLNLGGGSGEVLVFYSKFLLGGKGWGQPRRTLPALLTMPTLPAKGAGKVVGAVQSAGASL